MAESVPLLVALGVVFAAAVVLAAAEASLLRVSRVSAAVRAEEGDRAAARVLRLVDDLPLVMNTILLVVLLAQIGAATIAGYVAERHFGNAGVTVASVGLTLVMFVYAEAIPKTVAVRHPLRVARAVSVPMAVLSTVLRPIIRVLLAFADLQAPGKGIPPPHGVTEAELRRLALEAAEAGHIGMSDLEMIERAFAAGDEPVGAVLVPRIDVVAVDAAAALGDALDLALRHGHRRLPVIRKDLDDVVGVVRLRDLAAAVAAGTDTTPLELSEPALVVPEQRRVMDVLRDLQRQPGTLAVVVDEHGGTAGIVTIEDVVAEIVGETREPGRPPDISRTGPGRWLVAGSADVDDLADALGADLPEGDWHTAAGLVLGLTGRIPAAGDELTVAGHRFRVTAATGRRITTIEVEATG
jgi:CBS domain containing-hemolysin-like protein